MADRPWSGSALARRTLETALGAGLVLPAPTGLTHLQFRRFAGCPVCNLHLRTFERRHPELAAAGVHTVAVFHSTADELRPHVAELPFAVVGDPDKALYREFGVEASPWVMADPRAWPLVARAMARSSVLVLRGRTRPPALRPRGGRYGQPADFLFDSTGRLVAHHYATHLDDCWSVDDVLALARTAGVGPAEGVSA